MRRRLVVLAALIGASPAAGQVVSAAPERASVTVYRLDDDEAGVPLDEIEASDGLAMITESRSVDLPAGRSRIAFRGVADTMVPQTAAVEGLPGAMIERNQDYNLLAPGALIEVAIGRPVQLVRTNPKTGQPSVRTAVVRAGAQGPVLEVDGRIEALGCSGAPERLVFDGVPPGLADKPTFSVLADAPRAGRYKIRLSYLATGLAWSANYVAHVAPDGRSLDLLGWVTLANQTSSSFTEAPTDVVAGTLSREEETRPEPVTSQPLIQQCWHPAVAAAAPAENALVEEIVVTAARRPATAEAVVEEVIAKQSDLGDYKLYTLPEPTTVASHQTKQVKFLDQKAVPFDRVYAFTYDADDQEEGPRPAQVVLRLRNKADAGLGRPLPAGAVVVMETPPGRAPVLVGQRGIGDTPVGLPLDLALGQAADVQVEVRERARPGEDGERRTFDAEFTNAKANPVVLEYRHRGTDRIRVVSATRRAGNRDGQPLWTLRLGPESKTTLKYVVVDEE